MVSFSFLCGWLLLMSVRFLSFGPFLAMASVDLSAASDDDSEGTITPEPVNDGDFPPLVGELTETNVQLYEQKNQPMGKLFVRGLSSVPGGREDLFERLQDAAERFPSILFVVVDTSIKFWSQEPTRFGLGDRKITFAVESRPFKFVFMGKASAANITEFCIKVMAGKVRPFWRSQPVLPREAATEGHVLTIVSKNFESIVMDQSKNVIVLFFAPWCGHCQAFLPIYSRIADHFASSSLVQFTQMDAGANDIPLQFQFPIQGFPTLYIALQGPEAKSKPVAYKGQWVFEPVVAWVKEMIQSGLSASGDDEELEGLANEAKSPEKAKRKSAAASSSSSETSGDADSKPTEKKKKRKTKLQGKKLKSSPQPTVSTEEGENEPNALDETEKEATGKRDAEPTILSDEPKAHIPAIDADLQYSSSEQERLAGLVKDLQKTVEAQARELTILRLRLVKLEQTVQDIAEEVAP